VLLVHYESVGSASHRRYTETQVDGAASSPPSLRTMPKEREHSRAFTLVVKSSSMEVTHFTSIHNSSGRTSQVAPPNFKEARTSNPPSAQKEERMGYQHAATLTITLTKYLFINSQYI
jgi:hypothetical protein